MTVSGKQVTLAVFRQLRNEPVIGADGELAGQLWGVVNYHPDKCADKAAHWHVVWQRGSDLLRSLVPADAGHGWFWPDEGDRLVTAAVREFVVHGTYGPFTGPLPLKDLANWLDETSPGMVLESVPFEVRGALSECGTRVAKAALDRNQARELAQLRSDEPWYEQRRQAAEEALAAQLAQLDEEIAEYGADMQQLLAEYRAAVAAERSRRERHARARAAIADLPQLFIAV